MTPRSDIPLPGTRRDRALLPACRLGAPPVLIQCARGEILEGDSDAIAVRLRAVGATVTLLTETGVRHVWRNVAGRTPKADRAVAAMARSLQ